MQTTLLLEHTEFSQNFSFLNSSGLNAFLLDDFVAVSLVDRSPDLPIRQCSCCTDNIRPLAKPGRRRPNWEILFN